MDRPTESRSTPTQQYPSKKIKPDDGAVALIAPEAVLSDEYYDSVRLSDAYIGRVIDKSQIGSLIQDMKTVLPMPARLGHLKRVKGNEVILALTDEIDKSRCLELVRSKLRQLDGVICAAKVPLGPLRTKRQHQEANSYWSCGFHPDKRVESMISGKYFSPEELTKHYKYMRIGIDLAKENNARSAALVVDPKQDQVMGSGFDKRLANPALHATMAALDMVAENQRLKFLCRPKSEQTSSFYVSTDDDLPYLCTGYDLYVTREPCLMCAMASVHCRIRRVFYGCQTPDGALGTKTKLHTQTQLNHHYLVFRNILKDECEKLTNLSESVVQAELSL